MSNDESAAKPKRDHLGCLLLTGLGWAIYADLHVKRAVRAEVERVLQEDREKWVAEVRAGNSDVNIDDAKMLQMLTDDPVCRENVTTICFTRINLGDPQFRYVREFPNLTELFFYDCDNADNVMAAAKDVPGIESLYFEVTHVSDETLRSFAEFPNLKKVRFEQVMRDATIDELRRLLPDVQIEACLQSEAAKYQKQHNEQETTKPE